MEAEERPSKIRRTLDGSSDISITQQDQTPLDVNGILQNDEATEESNPERLPEKSSPTGETAPQDPPMSKSAKKRLARKEAWEAGRDERKSKRREKRIATRQRKKLERAEAGGANPSETLQRSQEVSKAPQHIDIPITFLIDCGFDEHMTEKEIVSITSQVTRCYSDNRKAIYRPVLAISSFGDRIKTRFETVLSNHHKHWTHTHLEEGDFVEVAEQAKKWMQEKSAIGLEDCPASKSWEDASSKNGEIVYLTADSDETLEELRPYSTYIIGGIVDRNRHKGICYKRAKDRGIKTAKLPIGDFIQMSSRAVLATNHVYEIMLRWLELNDWGEAFMRVIPKRKGGVLKDDTIDPDTVNSVDIDEEPEGGDDVVNVEGVKTE